MVEVEEAVRSDPEFLTGIGLPSCSCVLGDEGGILSYLHGDATGVHHESRQRESPPKDFCGFLPDVFTRYLASAERTGCLEQTTVLNSLCSLVEVQRTMPHACRQAHPIGCFERIEAQ